MLVVECVDLGVGIDAAVMAGVVVRIVLFKSGKDVLGAATTLTRRGKAGALVPGISIAQDLKIG